LKYARSLGYTIIDLIVDSIIVAQAIQTGRSRSIMGHSLVKHIRQLMCLNWDVSVAHVFCEANYYVDTLVNYGCSIDNGILYFDVCPSQLRHLLLDDIMGITTPMIITL
jgi:hypothetical protein